MILRHIENHKSIEQKFQDVELPNFLVLTGKNGTGKTHLLTGIKEGKLTIDNLNSKEILYLSYLDFAQNFQTRTNRAEQLNAWERFKASGQGGDMFFQLKQQLNILSQYEEVIEKSAFRVDKPILNLNIDEILTEEIELKQDIYSAIQNAKQGLLTIANQPQYEGEYIGQSVADSILKKTKVLPANITESFFHSNFQRTVFGNSKILSDLSNVFFEYYKNIDRNERNERRKKEFLNKEEFYKKFGQPPWELIRNIFIGFGLQFDINDPIQEDVDPLDGSFGIVFKNLDRGGKEVSFADLSSGEQILITLVNALYTAGNREGLPKVILLDEVDSPLNPSVIDKFISYIFENFISNGIKIILATHSPSTVAFAPEDSIYLVNTRNSEPLKFTNSADAIDVLSEGFITLGDVMNFNSIPQTKIIISEGKNYKYLIKAKEFFATHDSNLTVLNLNIGGTSQLRTLFEFMRNFNISKTFIFVFDCDYIYKETRNEDGGLKKDENGIQLYENRDLQSLNKSANTNNKIYILPENKDSSSSRGIENMFTKETSQIYSGKFDEKSPKNKSGFEKFILGRNLIADFKNFEPLFEFIKSGTSNINQS